MYKKCSSCKETKSINEFGLLKRSSDGYSWSCSSCLKKYQSAYHKKNKVHIKELNREYAKKNKEKLFSKYKEYSKTNKAKESHRKSVARHKERNPEKYKARTAVGNALRDGRLIRPVKCSKCPNTEKLEAHHPVYSKPLEVIWVCPGCHVEIHKQLKKKENK